MWIRALSLLAISVSVSACQKPAPAQAAVAPREPAPAAACPIKEAGEMVGVLARFKALAGKEEEALALLRETSAKVRETEPTTLVYLFFRGKKDPQEIIIFEIYQDTATRKTHAESATIAAVKARLPELIDMSTLVLEPTDASFMGFVR